MQKNSNEQQIREQQIKQLNQIICICKGIKLARILPALKHCQTVSEVNECVGTGSGGCAGERCGPKIKVLLSKAQQLPPKPSP